MEKNGINTQLEERLIVSLAKYAALIQNGGTIQKTEKAIVDLGAVWKKQNLINLSMNLKSDCCNAEIKQPEITFWGGLPHQKPSPTCSQCGAKILLQPIKKDLMKALQEKTKPKTTKYYQVKSTVAGYTYMQIVTGKSPVDALNTFQLNNPKDSVTDIKLIEIIQEDTNQ